MRALVNTIDGQSAMHGWVRTIGSGGMFVETNVPMPRDAEVGIVFQAKQGSATRSVKALGWVVYQDSSGVGLQFDRGSISDPGRVRKLVVHYLENRAPTEN
ncbi:MAG: hypothetical protein OEY97_01970 [Nitrospirota bacterium]|nr:hypothetical protein [Nitrospirota bacterium]